MIYELRTYEAVPGKMRALQARFRDQTLAIWKKHGITPVGFWTYAHGGWSDQLVYMLQFEDMADRSAKFGAFRTDADWAAAVKESEKDGPLTVRIRSDLLNPTDFSPLQ
jgi:hypothetical protein